MSAGNWKRSVRPFAARAATAIFKCLPTSLSVLVKENIRLSGALDYPAAPLRMELSCAIQRSRLLACGKEPETVGWLEKSFRAGDVLYDIGANVGAYSLVACAVARGQCRVIAFEPSFATHAALCQNVMLNRFCGAITPLNTLLWNRNELLRLEFSDTLAGAALHRVGDSSSINGQTAFVDVPAFRLDDLVQTLQLPPPTHLKIDVDGAEQQVLEGAAKVLASPSLRSVLIELDKNPASEQLLGHLASFGLRVAAKHPHQSTVVNYVLEKARA